MSILDKINESISESDTNNETNETKNNQIQAHIQKLNTINSQKVQENEQLKAQLKEAKTVNQRNLNEINELKSLINNLNSQITNLKDSYNNNIKTLQAQIDFEKEINEKYLSKIAKSNNELTTTIKEHNDKYAQDNQEIKSLLNNQDSSSETDNTTSNEIEDLKQLITKSNDDVKNLINKVNEESISSNKQIIDEINNQKSNITEVLSTNNNILDDNFKQVTDIIAKNRENHNNTSSKIIEKIDDIPSNDNSEHIEDIKSLINNNKTQLDNATNKIIDEVSNNSNQISVNDMLVKFDESLKSYNDDLINSLTSRSDNVKIDILNKISDDLRNGNYVNLDAYKKIKEYGLFDEIFYKKEYDYNLDIDPLLHFIYQGYDENKKPSENFNPLDYKQSHDNIKESSLNPLVYFVTHGINEGNIKINKEFPEIKHINKYDIDEDIKNFTIRGVKKSKRKPRLIVSITTKANQINDLHYTLYSLLNQQLKADKVILWLNKDEYPNQELDLPKQILKLKQNGLSIRFTENYDQYNQIIPALKTYPNDIIITAQNNIYYPPNWLKILYEDYKNNNNTILAHRAKTITFDDKNNMETYEKWTINEDENNKTYHNFPDTKAGVLYPPNSLHPDVTNKDIINTTTDNVDSWLWAMTILSHNKIKVVKNKLNEITYVNPAIKANLLNNQEQRKDIDTNIKNILDKYPEIYEILNE